MFENLERALFIVRLFVDHELLPFDHYFWFGLWISDVVIPWKLSQLRVLKSTHFRLDYPKSTLNLFFIWNQWNSPKKNKEKEFKISTTLQNTLKFCSLQYITKLFCPSICSDSAHFQISSPKSALNISPFQNQSAEPWLGVDKTILTCINLFANILPYCPRDSHKWI